MAEFEKRLACVIRADGTIARGYMIDKCQFDGANQYTITWLSTAETVLEGERAQTLNIYDRILKDARHSGIKNIGQEKIDHLSPHSPIDA